MDAFPRGRLPAAVALVAVTLLAVAAWLAELPPTPAGRDAPPGSFSAERAWPVLERLAGEPTPIGSAAGDAARGHLVAELTRLGLRPEEQTATGAHAFGGGDVVAGVAENVIAVIPGRDSTGRVVLAAHYDSTPTTPGASDDKASVATILEIARALRTGPPLRNDVVILLSDGEEPGLIGAEAFARHPLARDGGVVVNLEGPGNAAPSAVYNVTPGGGALVGAFARAMPHPVGESALVDAYRETGFHSDLSALEEKGWIGIDLGLAGGRAYYHHPRDTPAALDRGALQMHGDNALAMVRELGGADLRELRAPPDEVFFALFGVVFRYPAGLATPLAVLAVLTVLAVAWYARSSSRRAADRAPVTVPRLLAGAGAVLVMLVVMIALSIGLWPVLVALDPGYGDLVSDPYQPGPYRLALIATAVAVVWAGCVTLRRWLNPVVLTLGVLFWLAALGIAGALLMPGASHYGSLPALAGTAGLAAALARNRRRSTQQVTPAATPAAIPQATQTAAAPTATSQVTRPAPPADASGVWVMVVLALGVVPGVVLFSVGARSIGTATGLAMAAPAGLFYGFAVLAALPLLTAVTPEGGGVPAGAVRRRIGRWGGPAGAGVLALALVAVGLQVNRFGAEQPRLAHLAYVLDADARQGTWVSMTEPPHPWAAERAPHVPASWDLPLPYRQRPARVGPAPAVTLPAPELTVLEERRDGDETVLRVRVRSQRAAYQLNLHVAAPVESGEFRAAGHAAVPLPPTEKEAGPWPFEVQFFAPPPEGVEFTLRVAGAARPRLAVADVTLGFDGVPGSRPRPPGVDKTPSGGGLPTDSVTVVRTL
ncbi:M28 family peptidase [Nonomuraea sp. NPDC048826]|uniref:M28 family peptidase n=1 Tax=Nonomuraea sp. NPDC048826 TaxID=3364347 RepID=UPI00371A2971